MVNLKIQWSEVRVFVLFLVLHAGHSCIGLYGRMGIKTDFALDIHNLVKREVSSS